MEREGVTAWECTYQRAIHLRIVQARRLSFKPLVESFNQFLELQAFSLSFKPTA
jgi:hypothetical protein